MSLSDYDGLQQSIADHLDDDELSDQIVDFISLAESRHKREIRIREMITRADLAIAEGDRYVDLPDDFLDHKFLRVLAPSGSQVRRRYIPGVEEVSLAELTDSSDLEDSPPGKYAIHEQIEFQAEADQDYTGEIFYYVELTALSDSNPSNALLAKAPDCYLYAALLASAPFLVNDERLKTWSDLYVQGRDELNRSSRESRRGGPLVSRVRGATP